MSYFRATDPFPLQSADQTKLHEFYARLAEGRLVTTSCARCGSVDWPPRGFCPRCISDEFAWVELPREGTIHGFTVQETGMPHGFETPRVFAIVNVGPVRIFAPIAGGATAAVSVGARVRLAPIRIADDPRGQARYLVAFESMEGSG
jgi:uncharacterized OB-fold protein